MDKFSRAFVGMALVWLVVASLMGFGLEHGLGSVDYENFRFVHVHLNLIGFMAMMVFGIGYFILPRFSGNRLRWPALPGVHFWLANVGIVLMSAAKLGWLSGPARSGVFDLGAGIEIVGFIMFALNVGLSIQPVQLGRSASAPARKPEAQPTEAPVAVMTPETTVGELLTRYPELLQVLVEEGLTPLADPGHVEMVKRAGIPLIKAAASHGIDFERLKSRLEEEIKKGASAGTQPGIQNPPISSGGAIERVVSRMVIGELVESHPKTREVFRRHFGSGCFDCPGQAFETVEQAAMMHNSDPSILVKDLISAMNES